jgi:methionine-rich copper-binding protein CopC
VKYFLTSLVSLLLLCAASPAGADASVVSTNPEAGSRVTALSEITMTFSTGLIEGSSTILVVDASDKNWSRGDANLDGNALTQPLAGSLPPGEYEVRWRTVSADGHPISDVFSFAVDGSSAAPSPSASAGTTPTPESAELAGVNDEESGHHALLIGAFVTILIVGSCLVAFLGRKRRA